MREIVLGTAGHVDHGKTSLVRALTGQETDRLQEEKKRGITIELGFAWLDLPCGRRLGIVDVPGHEKFVKTMVSGVSGIDLAAFVIAADEGIMPQTVEHFEICRLMGVEQGIVVITKKDMVEPEWLEMVEEEVRQFCEGTFLEDAKIIATSSVSGEGIEAVRDELDRLVRSHQFEETFGAFRLPVDRSFSIKGFGAVVTGTSISGRAAVGDELRLFPSEKRVKVRGIQVHLQEVGEVEAGHRTAVNLQGIDAAEIERGMVLASEDALEPSYMLDVSLLYLGGGVGKIDKPLKHRSRVRVHIGTKEVYGRISLLTCDELPAGEECAAQLLLEEQVCVWPYDRFVIRSYSPVATIGGGEVLGNVPPRKRKRLQAKDREKNAALYAVYRGEDIADKILHLLQERGGQGLCGGELGIRLGLFGKHLKKALQGPLSAKKIAVVDSQSQRYITTESAEKLQALLVEKLRHYHEEHPLIAGIVKEELRTGLDRPVEQKVFNYCLSELIKKDMVIREDSLLHLAGHTVSLKADADELAQGLMLWYKKNGAQTPTIKETVEHFADYSQTLLKEVMDIKLRSGELIKIDESLYYCSDILQPIVDSTVAYLSENGEIDAQAFKDLTGLSRKFSIPLLEYLDREKITLRVGNKRLLRGR